MQNKHYVIGTCFKKELDKKFDLNCDDSLHCRRGVMGSMIPYFIKKSTYGYKFLSEKSDQRNNKNIDLTTASLMGYHLDKMVERPCPLYK